MLYTLDRRSGNETSDRRSGNETSDTHTNEELKHKCKNVYRQCTCYVEPFYTIQDVIR